MIVQSTQQSAPHKWHTEEASISQEQLRKKEVERDAARVFLDVDKIDDRIVRAEELELYFLDTEAVMDLLPTLHVQLKQDFFKALVNAVKILAEGAGEPGLDQETFVTLFTKLHGDANLRTTMQLHILAIRVEKRVQELRTDVEHIARRLRDVKRNQAGVLDKLEMLLYHLRLRRVRRRQFPARVPRTGSCGSRSLTASCPLPAANSEVVNSRALGATLPSLVTRPATLTDGADAAGEV